MSDKIKESVLAAGWRFPFIRAISSRQPVILMYHDIPAEGDGTCIDSKVFEGHIELLKQHFRLISPDEFSKDRKPLGKIHVLLTFDDGFRNHAEVVAPILRRHHVPAVFFVCSRHALRGKYLWFSYLRALEKHFSGSGFYFRGKFIDMSPEQRQINIRRLWEHLLNLTPHPAAMYQAIEEELPRLEDFLDQEELIGRYVGMTAEQVSELARDPLFSIGVHTVDHPFLTKCGREEAFRQIQVNRVWLEEVCNHPCNTIAYPSGDYDNELLDQCQNLGFIRGYAVTRKLNRYPHLEFKRIGLYSTSVNMLGFKVQWGNLARFLQINMH
jgi:peptidoglycan/xylan/chitin deacetylase (PgdA/CDA1 family)